MDTKTQTPSKKNRPAIIAAALGAALCLAVAPLLTPQADATMSNGGFLVRSVDTAGNEAVVGMTPEAGATTPGEGEEVPSQSREITWIDFAGINNGRWAGRVERDGALRNFPISQELPDGYSLTAKLSRTGSASHIEAVQADGLKRHFVLSRVLNKPAVPIIYDMGRPMVPSALSASYTLTDVVVKDAAGAPVKDYKLILADGEMTSMDESMTFQANGLAPHGDLRANACNAQYEIAAGVATCKASFHYMGTGEQATGSPVFEAEGATGATISLTSSRAGGMQGVAFGVLLD